MTDELQDTAPAEPTPISEGQQEAVQDQTPDPKADEPKAEAAPKKSLRESLEAAFDQVDDGEGADDTASTERLRGPDGKFIAKDGEPDAAPAEAEDKQQAAPDKAKLSEAPSRFSPDAKQAWAEAPESVRGEINRAIQEMESGLQQKDQALEPLKPYIDMAEKHGTTVHDALGNYVRMEEALRQDPASGLKQLAQNLGMSPQDMAGLLTGQQAEQGAQQPEGAKDREIATLKQELEQIKGQVGQVTQTQQEAQQKEIMAQVDAFAKDKPRFEELAPEIQRMLETGYASDLADAYEKAEKMNPSQLAAQAAPANPAHTRQPRSVTGAPNAGSNPGNRQPSKDPREAISRAFGQAGLA